MILASVRKVVARYLCTDKVETAVPTPPAVRPVSVTVVKPSKFLGPQTLSDAKVLERLQMGPASALVLQFLSGLKRPRYAIARLRQRGLDIPVNQRFAADSLSFPRRECIYHLSRRDKAQVERWKRARIQSDETVTGQQNRAMLNGNWGDQ